MFIILHMTNTRSLTYIYITKILFIFCSSFPLPNPNRFLKDVKFHHELAKEDVSDYIENPINAFTLIKRMVNDWKDLFEFLKFQDVKNGEYVCGCVYIDLLWKY